MNQQVIEKSEVHRCRGRVVVLTTGKSAGHDRVVQAMFPEGVIKMIDQKLKEFNKAHKTNISRAQFVDSIIPKLDWEQAVLEALADWAEHGRKHLALSQELAALQLKLNGGDAPSRSRK